MRIATCAKPLGVSWATFPLTEAIPLVESPLRTIALIRAEAWPIEHVLPLAALILLSVSAVSAMVYMRYLRKRHSALSTDLVTIADQRREAERALRETEAIYYSLVETLPQSILRKDLEGRFTFANKRFCAELGFPELFGKHDALVTYYWMFGPQRERPCPMCTNWLGAIEGNA